MRNGQRPDIKLATSGIVETLLLIQGGIGIKKSGEGSRQHIRTTCVDPHIQNQSRNIAGIKKSDGIPETGINAGQGCRIPPFAGQFQITKTAWLKDFIGYNRSGIHWQQGCLVKCSVVVINCSEG